ncbi:unnamed protein product [Vitrella brassicaformis CCMP3155]|uniref:EF-hand domain-containing protein n=1 Tax=Vitrella brassicaformis (strain CCMP3155) TaxID=1169540 RepID=A0A0G4F3S4_VITBC|nr:unnamed protein product [Vitrella brassicaformis CCMP3155]|eukprot:CEM06490.1 unnamed protein product [Vitrella brassicaformis CCMP3155]
MAHRQAQRSLRALPAFPTPPPTLLRPVQATSARTYSSGVVNVQPTFSPIRDFAEFYTSLRVVPKTDPAASHVDPGTAFLYVRNVLKDVPVAEALEIFSMGQVKGFVDETAFKRALTCVLERYHNHPLHHSNGLTIPDGLLDAAWGIFDKLRQGKVNVLELTPTICFYCKGTVEDRIDAVFALFDEDHNGYIEFEEMTKLLTSLYRVTLTEKTKQVLSDFKIDVQTPEELSNLTATECFRAADVNHDRKLSPEEFKVWCLTPPTQLSPGESLLRTPLSNLLLAIMEPQKPF